MATLSCALLVHLLRKYDVFHINFRTILWNILICVMCNNIIQCIRPFIAVYQTYDMDSRSQYEDSTCSELNVLPVPFCVFITLSGIVMCVERLYATFAYAIYEYENYTWLYDRVFLVMWVIFVICSLGNVFDYTSADFNYFECSFIQMTKNPLKTHWHILIMAVFQAVYIVIFSSVVSLNKEKQTVYIKNHYNSLSPRFQIGENIKATRLLVHFTVVVFIAMLVIMGTKSADYAIVYHWYVPYLPHPIPRFLRQNEVIHQGATAELPTTVTSGHGKKCGLVSSSNNQYIDLLTNSWEDAMHLG
ncbi:unnamed protein product [Bursaphelenchus okinawaensis]|uniref:G_PROTEIN_RECEP_F1_2 domain-containing protein n=1 Tax=Bursaphelenchus okinawaensis TaxID=465554 RepID=A0A811KYP5_9BILA|nr:unnamed protein product [Bursaphelenchus okinawaensis]CAG9114706.1 unnamed protein product [Bursaphelenchus okinawaensis]